MRGLASLLLLRMLPGTSCSRHVLTLQGEDVELSDGAAAKRLTFPACTATKVPAVIPPIPKPAAGGNPLLPKDSPHPARTLEVKMRDGVGLHTLVFFPCALTGTPRKGNATKQYCNTTAPPDHKVGTVLFRTPYNATFLSTEYPNGTAGPGISTQVFPFVTDPGLAVVIQDVRGCGPTYSAAVGCTSPGRGLFDFPNTSATDGYDTVEWITKQPWSNGRVALNGKSALAINSYELITLNPHPAIKAASLQFGEMTGHQQWFPGGAYRLAMAEIYLGTLANSKRDKRASEIIGKLRANEAWGPNWATMDANAVGKDGLSGWERGRKAAVPTIHTAGWYDVFSDEHLSGFFQLNNSALGATAPQWLWITPGGHCTKSAIGWPRFALIPPELQGKTTIDVLSRDWIDTHNELPVDIEYATMLLFQLQLQPPGSALRKLLQKQLDGFPRLSYYVNGPGIVGSIGNHWHTAQVWPTNIVTRRWYLEAGGRLATLPGDGLTESALLYDPANPHATYGGDNLFVSPCGPQDQTLTEATNESVTAYHALLNGRAGTQVTYHNGSSPCYNNSCVGHCLSEMQRLYKACIDSPRPDILRYTSEAFALPMTILGNVSVSLEVSSNASDTDFVAKLIDVWPNGTAMLVEQGAVRMRWRNGPFATRPAPHMRKNERYHIVRPITRRLLAR